jgi:hypothetical protein
LVEWKPWPFGNGGKLLGHATVVFAGGWVVHRVPIFRADDGSFSPGVPNAAEVDAEGRVKTRLDGSRAYRDVISFEGREAKRRWRDMIAGALHAAGIGGAP